LGFWAAYSYWYAQTRSAPPQGLVFPFLTASLLLFLAWPLWRVLYRKQALCVPDLLILALNPGFYFGACYSLFEGGTRSYAGLIAVILAAIEMGTARLLRGRDTRGAALAAAIGWALLVLAAPIQ